MRYQLDDEAIDRLHRTRDLVATTTNGDDPAGTLLYANAAIVADNLLAVAGESPEYIAGMVDTLTHVSQFVAIFMAMNPLPDSGPINDVLIMVQTHFSMIEASLALRPEVQVAMFGRVVE